MEGTSKCCVRRWYILPALISFMARETNGDAGPAHAVYFASYEATKHALGGNEGENHEHHPLAAGAQCSENCCPTLSLTRPQLPVEPQPPSPAMR